MPVDENKHPIGVKPRFIWERERLIALFSAVDRYTKYGIDIPTEWFDEIEELVAKQFQSSDKGVM